jgi:hypothetical protein
LLAPLAGRIYDHAPQQNAFPIAQTGPCMAGFDDYDPLPGHDLFILINLSVGGAIGWFAPEWLMGAVLVSSWTMLRCALAWLRESHLPFLAQTMARGDHYAFSPTRAFYFSIAAATVAASGSAAIGGAILRRIL